MRKISQLAAEAFINREPRSFGNTFVEVALTTINHKHEELVRMFLFGNCIAGWNPKEKIFSTTCAGYPSITTKERLNTLINHMYEALLILEPTTYYHRNKKLYWGSTLIKYFTSYQWFATTRSIEQEKQKIALSTKQIWDLLL